MRRFRWTMNDTMTRLVHKGKGRREKGLSFTTKATKSVLEPRQRLKRGEEESGERENS